ncbi:enoyl-CoA hydratase/isomerase family protein [Streptacidiphilus neutrinimicus]|uniref:enoyl-CoA hydratase/isomerase family protein n=1 Tax=Streptacidiphilus neutrinimicus TaxID=105420 RepID=UPI0005A78C07|nr:enoyl-CoA hydratase/isomerase family protein [Streptacidiphilus neutrinimicus]
MSGDAVLLVQDAAPGVRRLTLNRPGALNAVTAELRERLIAALDEASADRSVRVVVLTGAGRAFCSGADLSGGTSRTAGGAAAPPVAGDVARMLRHGVQRMITAVLDCEKPVLCALNGVAAGVGVQLALACDLVVAAEEASLVQVFGKRGLVPDGGAAWLLPRLVGLQRAKELLFFGDKVRAVDAERLGLVNRVVPGRELEKAVAEWSERLAAGPTRAYALTKALVNASLDADRASCFAAEATAQEINMTTFDAQEGVRAFVERREAGFEGR